jgi:hypothetical protein
LCFVCHLSDGIIFAQIPLSLFFQRHNSVLNGR